MRRNKSSRLQFQKSSPLAPNILSFLVVCSFPALISNIWHIWQDQRGRETASSETERENGCWKVSKIIWFVRARVMGNSLSIQSQYMTQFKGLLKGSGVKVKDKSFKELFHHVHRHCYWFHPEGRTVLNYKVWKNVMRALQRAQQEGT
jgi:hypothetical protein